MAHEITQKNSRRVFTEEEIKRIRQRGVYDNLSYRQLQQEFGADLKTLWNILNLVTYKEIPVADDYYNLLKLKSKE
jgi:RNAse (barnase) inhibitor barstar